MTTAMHALLIYRTVFFSREALSTFSKLTQVSKVGSAVEGIDDRNPAFGHHEEIRQDQAHRQLVGRGPKGPVSVWGWKEEGKRTYIVSVLRSCLWIDMYRLDRAAFGNISLKLFFIGTNMFI